MSKTPITRYAPQSTTRQVRARSQETVAYHYDDQKPGKPLYLLIPGALIALGALALIAIIMYKTFFDSSLDSALGTGLALLLAPIYIGGVFLFSYGYELYDIPKAIRLTVIIVFITVAAVVMVAALGAVLGALGGGKSDSSSSKSSSSSSSRSSSSGGGRSSVGRFLDGIGPVFINTPSSTQTVTREVVREVPVPPPAPQPITCSHCGRPYVPEENKYACPSCGAPTPAEFVPQ